MTKQAESLYDIPAGCICKGDGLLGMKCTAPKHATLKQPYAVKYEGNIPKTLRDYADKHAHQIVEISYGDGYCTDSGMAYDVMLRSGWCDGMDPLGACHTLIEPTVRDILGALRAVRPCDCEGCKAESE